MKIKEANNNSFSRKAVHFSAHGPLKKWYQRRQYSIWNSKKTHFFIKEKHIKEPCDFYFKIFIMLNIILVDDNLINSDFLHAHFGGRLFSSIYCHCLVFASAPQNPSPLWKILCTWLSINFFSLYYFNYYCHYIPLEPFVLSMVSKLWKESFMERSHFHTETLFLL